MHVSGVDKCLNWIEKDQNIENPDYDVQDQEIKYQEQIKD